MDETPQVRRPEPEEGEPAELAEPAAEEPEVVAHAVSESEDGYGAQGDGAPGWCIGASSAN